MRNPAMPLTWASHIVDNVLMGCKTLPNQPVSKSQLMRDSEDAPDSHHYLEADT